MPNQLLFPVCAFSVLLDKKGRGFHDKEAENYVIDLVKTEELQNSQ